MPIPSRHHSQKLHDHLGWPGPHHPDHSCQAWDFADDPYGILHHDMGACRRFIDPKRLIPIHLKKEGYTQLSTIIEHIGGDDRIDLISSNERFDDRNDWVVKLKLKSIGSLTSENNKPLEPAKFRISVFATGVLHEDEGERTDLVYIGEVEVLPTAAMIG